MITKSLTSLKLGNKIHLPGTPLFAGLTQEDMCLILVEKHQEDYVFDVVYHGVVVGQASTNSVSKEWDVWGL